MAKSPTEWYGQLNEADKTASDHLELAIDAAMEKDAPKGSDDKFVFFTPKPNIRVQEEIRKRYMKAGWGLIQFYGDHITFEKPFTGYQR
jgi:hypothetical protein